MRDVLTKKRKPEQAGKQNDETGIEESRRPQVWFQFVSHQDFPKDKGKNYGSGQANHPNRKVGADDVNGWGAYTASETANDW